MFTLEFPSHVFCGLPEKAGGRVPDEQKKAPPECIPPKELFLLYYIYLKSHCLSRASLSLFMARARDA